MAVRGATLDDGRVIQIPWRRIGVWAGVALAVIAAWFVTTNTYSRLWQQNLTGRWDAIVAEGAPVVALPGQPVARLSIPTLGIDRVVLEGVDHATLRKGPGHLPGTPLPGEQGNSVIQGHRLLWSGPFRDLSRLSFGAPIEVQLSDGTVLRFLVAGVLPMAPGDPNIAKESPNTMLTLVTSDPPLRADRVLVIRAVLPGGGR